MENNELLKKIGQKIKIIRQQKGISQQELAAMINYEKSNMSRLESGGTNPTILTLDKIAKALGVEISALLDD